MKKRVGRPKRTDVTKRIQCVIPDEVLIQLDDKIKSLHDSKIDRSKVITESIKSWLGITNSRRNFDNIYTKFFSLSDRTFTGLFSKNESKDLSEELVGDIIDKIVTGKPLTDEDLVKLNELLSQQKITINNDLEIHSNFESILGLEKMLFLNMKYPMKDYLGKCKWCGNHFIKKRSDQQYDTTACKIEYYKNKAIKNTKLNNEIEKIRNSIDYSSISLLSFINQDNIGSSYIEKAKNIIAKICLECNYSFPKLKKYIENALENDKGNTRLTRFLINLAGDYESSFLMKEISLEEIEKIEFDSWAKKTAREFFPIKNNIRYHFEKWLKSRFSQKRFYIEKNKVIALKKIIQAEIQLDFIKYISAKESMKKSIEDSIDYFENNYELEEGYNKETQTNKTIFIIRNKLELVDFDLTSIEEGIKCCNEILESYPNCVDARCLMIYLKIKNCLKNGWISWINYLNEFSQTNYFNLNKFGNIFPNLLNDILEEIIFHYEKIEDSINRSVILDINPKVTNRFTSPEEEMLAIPIYPDIMEIVEKFACISYFFTQNDKYKKIFDEKKLISGLYAQKKSFTNYYINSFKDIDFNKINCFAVIDGFYAEFLIKFNNYLNFFVTILVNIVTKKWGIRNVIYLQKTFDSFVKIIEKLGSKEVFQSNEEYFNNLPETVKQKLVEEYYTLRVTVSAILELINDNIKRIKSESKK